MPVRRCSLSTWTSWGGVGWRLGRFCGVGAWRTRSLADSIRAQPPANGESHMNARTLMAVSAVALALTAGCKGAGAASDSAKTGAAGAPVDEAAVRKAIA